MRSRRSSISSKTARACSSPGSRGAASGPCASWLPSHASALGGATAALLPHRTSRALLAGRSCLRLGSAQGGAIDVDADAAVPQAVEEGIDEMLLPKQLVPVVELERRRDDGRDAIVALVDEPEERVGLLRLDVEIVDLVDDQRLQPAQPLEQPGSRAVGERGVKLIEEVLGIIEAAAVAIEAGFAQDADGNSRLAGPGFPREHDIVCPAQEVEPGQGLDLPPVDAGLRIEGEGFERPVPGQPRLLEPIGKA